MKGFGYTGRLLKIDLSSGKTEFLSTHDYASRFLGGRGLAAWIYFQEMPPDAFSPQNPLIFVTGPLTGVFGLPGNARWQVCGRSPVTTPQHFAYANLGGNWGVRLKMAGYDGLIVTGRAEKLSCLIIDEGKVEIRETPELKGETTVGVREKLKAELGESTAVAAIGPAGENLVALAIILADKDASGSAGFGAVMGSKNLKAIAVKGSGKVKIADPERLRQLLRYIRWLLGDRAKLEPHLQRGPGFRKDYCYSCPGPCVRVSGGSRDGRRGKFMCQSAVFYAPRARRFYNEDTEVPFIATRLCDEYGVDTNTADVMLTWLHRCFKEGIISEEEAGIPLSKMGSLECIEEFLRRLSFREGFGDLLAKGTEEAARSLGEESQKVIADYLHKSGQNSLYGPRLYITNGIIYATEPRQPIQQLHETSLLIDQWVEWVHGKEGAYVSSEVVRAVAKRFWGSELAADFSTYEAKALAARMIQDREYAKECLILCDFIWPIMVSPNTPDYVGDPTLESRLLSAVTGMGVDEAELYRFGERAFNLQRAILALEGHRGRDDDRLPEFCYSIPLARHFINPECLVPGRGGEVICRKGAVVEREKFEALKDEYYRLRGWDVSSGLQTGAKLKELGLDDVAKRLEGEGLLR